MTNDPHVLSRRQLMQRMAGAFALASGGLDSLASIARAADPTRNATTSPAGWPGTARFPEKTDLLLLTDRPPNLETPLRYFREDFTPNDAFYVRWHMPPLTRIDADRFRLAIGGEVEAPLSLSLDDLRRNFEPVSVVAVNQCSGNSRSEFEPRMPGVQWGNGAMGNARWTGVRLRDLLGKAKLKPGAVDVSFNGLDEAVLQPAPGYAGTPDFIKSLPIDRANDGEVMVAYEMNGEPLPMLNGFPLRLVVPGWFATYWVKAPCEITVLDKPFAGYWMAKAYRIPKTEDVNESPESLAKETVPIDRMPVRSLFVRPEPDEQVKANMEYEVQGLALDAGAGIRIVEISSDGGATWSAARLDRDLGKYSWRRWRFPWRPQPGRHRLMVRATNRDGESQVQAQWNRSGYARHVIESIEVNVV